MPMRLPEPTVTFPPEGGIQRRYLFDNGYSVSAICTPLSQGGDCGLWEVAIFDRTGAITNVEGYMTEAWVDRTLQEVAQFLIHSR